MVHWGSGQSINTVHTDSLVTILQLIGHRIGADAGTSGHRRDAGGGDHEITGTKLGGWEKNG